jgi:hypothetical protein
MISVADLGSVIWCFLDPCFRDLRWVQCHHPDPGSGSEMINPDHISKRLETIFCFKILKFFDGDPGSGIGKNSDSGSRMEKIWIRDPG